MNREKKIIYEIEYRYRKMDAVWSILGFRIYFSIGEALDALEKAKTQFSNRDFRVKKITTEILFDEEQCKDS